LFLASDPRSSRFCKTSSPQKSLKNKSTLW
jgi:hypothetical protein